MSSQQQKYEFYSDRQTEIDYVPPSIKCYTCWPRKICICPAESENESSITNTQSDIGMWQYVDFCPEIHTNQNIYIIKN